jgi:ubiquinone/menaquinone biosynthesis C-methylase UbiE
MSEGLSYKDEAAAGYERAFAHVSTHFVPFLLRSARLAPGMHVLDIATGTGLAAEAALTAVGATGHVTATDISPQMAERARERLHGRANAMVAVEDGQALSLPEQSFDAVLCSLGLMFFPARRRVSPSSVVSSARVDVRPCRSTPCQSDHTTGGSTSS